MNLIRANESDVPRIMECARQFCAIIPDVPLDEPGYASYWMDCLRDNSGVIFLLEHEGEVAGGIGGVYSKEPLTGRRIAVELFWYVKPEYRGGSWPVRLLREFETWSVMAGCSHVCMIHMECSQPDRMGEFYQRRGYQLFETVYRKKL
jgi:GNAT superfamily N-acetyltransferase